MTKEKLSKLLNTVVALLTLVYGAILILSTVLFFANVNTPYTPENFLSQELNMLGDHVPTIIGFVAHVFAHSLLAFILVIASGIALKKGYNKSIIVCMVIITIFELVADILLGSSPLSALFSQIGFRPKFLYTILGVLGIVLAVVAKKLPDFIYSFQNEQENTITSTTMEHVQTTTPDSESAPVVDSTIVVNNANASKQIEQTAPTSQKKIVNEKKSAIIRTIVIYSIVAVVAFITGLFFGEIGLIFGIAAVGIAVYFCFYNIIAINRSFCAKCGAKYDYENEISWTVSHEENTGDAIYAYVDIECHCSDCGEIRQFQQKFKIAYYDKQKNTVVKKNIQTLVRNYFNKV